MPPWWTPVVNSASFAWRFLARRCGGGYNPQKSDLDFIANFLPPLHPGVADRFFGLAEALEKIFARPVDLLTDSMLRNPVLREEVNRDRTLIYDHGGQEKAA